jgi:hypothetical protein
MKDNNFHLTRPTTRGCRDAIQQNSTGGITSSASCAEFSKNTLKYFYSLRLHRSFEVKGPDKWIHLGVHPL